MKFDNNNNNNTNHINNNETSQVAVLRESAYKLIHDAIVDTIPYVDKVTYLEVYEQTPYLILLETDPLRYILYEKWNIWSAAQRIVKYWAWKKTLFGNINTFKSIFNLTGEIDSALNETEIAIIRSGIVSLPFPKDNDGNIIICFNRERAVYPEYEIQDVTTKLRILFFLSVCCTNSHYIEQTNTNTVSLQQHNNDNNDHLGVGDINNDNDSYHETKIIVVNFLTALVHTPSSLTVNLRAFVSEALTVRIIRLHTIFCPSKTKLNILNRYVIPTFLSINTPILEYYNLIFHCCSTSNEAGTKLNMRGIPYQCIPTEFGGTWSYYTFYQWLDDITTSQQIQYENQQQQVTTTTSTNAAVETTFCAPSIPNNQAIQYQFDNNNIGVSLPMSQSFLMVNGAENQQQQHVKHPVIESVNGDDVFHHINKNNIPTLSPELHGTTTMLPGTSFFWGNEISTSDQTFVTDDMPMFISSPNEDSNYNKNNVNDNNLIMPALGLATSTTDPDIIINNANNNWNDTFDQQQSDISQLFIVHNTTLPPSMILNESSQQEEQYPNPITLINAIRSDINTQIDNNNNVVQWNNTTMSSSFNEIENQNVLFMRNESCNYSHNNIQETIQPTPTIIQNINYNNMNNKNIQFFDCVDDNVIQQQLPVVLKKQLVSDNDDIMTTT